MNPLNERIDKFLERLNDAKKRNLYFYQAPIEKIYDLMLLLKAKI